MVFDQFIKKLPDKCVSSHQVGWLDDCPMRRGCATVMPLRGMRPGVLLAVACSLSIDGAKRSRGALNRTTRLQSGK